MATEDLEPASGPPERPTIDETEGLEGPGPEPSMFDPPPAAVKPGGRVRWGLGIGLLAASVLATGAVMPYTLTLVRQSNDQITDQMVPVIVVASLILEGVISAVAIVVGIGLGRRAGLGPYLLDGVDGGPGPGGPDDPSTIAPSRRRAWRAIGLAAMLGSVLGLTVVGLSYALRSQMPEPPRPFKMPSPAECLFGSLGAGVREEVWLRLGMMTFLAWLGMVVARRRPGDPASIWGANILAALLFGAIHLPQAAGFIGLNAAVVTFVLVGNGVPGAAFGWLFWRRGLVAAMVGHFMLDVVMKVIVPAFTE